MTDFNFVWRVLLAAGSLSLLFSISSSFIKFTIIPGPCSIPEYDFVMCELWSFRGVCRGYGLWSTFTETWFLNYWFHDNIIVMSGLSWILASLFIIQILTLVSAAISMFTSRNALSLAPTLLCPIAALLMTIPFIHLSQQHVRGLGSIHWINYLQGYWLTYLSETLFIASFLLRRRIAKLRKSFSTKPSLH